MRCIFCKIHFFHFIYELDREHALRNCVIYNAGHEAVEITMSIKVSVLGSSAQAHNNARCTATLLTLMLPTKTMIIMHLHAPYP